ncbi:MAG: hypothetical protein JNK47_17025 [Mesorhizobium sp.]|nr:hypothetical protein [Mesorhizobium sp.]MBL8578925.1 hypothetical protein [Mesorhizobium sp.]
MEELIAYHAETGPGTMFGFSGFNDNILLSLPLPAGRYVVHARLGIGNSDSDDQAMSCSIKVRGTLQYVDRVNYRLAGWSQPIWFALQGVVELYEGGDVLDLTAGTYKGYVSEPRILAFNVNAIVPPV